MYFQNSTKYNIILIVLLTVVCACKQSENTQEQSKQMNYLTIAPSATPQKASPTQIADELKVVPLETREECLIGFPYHIQHIDKDNIICTSRKSVLIFDINGKYISKVNRQGGGPEEYQSIGGVYVAADVKQINIIDGKQIKTYSYSGEFIKKRVLPFPISGICYTKEGLIATVQQRYDEKDRDALYIFDDELSVRKKFKSGNKKTLKKGIRQELFYGGSPRLLGDEVIYKEPLVDTIYVLKHQELMPQWVINYEKEPFSLEETLNLELSDKAFRTKITPPGIRQSSNFFFVDYFYRGAKYLSVFDKQRKEYIFHQKYTREKYPNPTDIVHFGLQNDLESNAPAFWPDYITDKILVDMISPDLFTDEQLKAFGCNAEDNPVLFIATETDHPSKSKGK